ncbi:MAG: hypothetical protein F6K32_14600 [Desertifilum sp. SIO1I2]|nr:hypothetical protein [Desertifilum sp. SIO1I2]
MPDERYLEFSAIPKTSDLQLHGEVYPLQIHDTFALDITLRYPYEQVTIDQLKGLNLEGCLLPENVQASLGQTLILFAEPIQPVENLQIFAENCLAQIIELPFDKSSYFISGKLLGSPIFEYEFEYQINSQKPTFYSHVAIWLNSHPKTEELEFAGNYYQPLINLLCCRSKVFYAYSESRWCNAKAREVYRKLENEIRKFGNLPLDPESRLKELKTILTKLPENALKFSQYLRDLETHCTTIEANLKNYQFWLRMLQNCTLKEQDDLNFLEQFIKRTQETFITQINIDLAYLLPSQRLFEEFIATIRGLVEIEQAERDRSLERTIQILGAGLGAGGIVASAISGHIQTPRTLPQVNLILNPPILALLWSLSAGLTVGVIVAWLNGAIAARKTRYLQKNDRSAIAPTSPPLPLPQQTQPEHRERS